MRAADQAPLVGARLHVSDPKAGKLFSSTPAGEDGSFAPVDLPPSTYRLAVESDGGLYLVEAPLALAPGAARTLTVAVNPQSANREAGPTDDFDEQKFGPLENPLTAALIVLGTATLIGVLLDDDAKSEGQASPAIPG